MIAGLVALGFFAIVAMAAALVDGSVRRARKRVEAWERRRRWATATVRITVSTTGFASAMARASRSVADFDAAWRRVREVTEPEPPDLAGGEA